MIRFYLAVRRYATLLMVFATSLALAQERSVSGRITSADDNSAIPGVNVLEKGTSNGTVSDSDGNFRINVGPNAVLVFSFVGYTTQEVTVGSQSTVNISLVSDVTALSEVVVVGYGLQDKKEITSSVVSVTTEGFNRGNVNDPALLLQGKVPGLSIYNRGGDPNTNATIRLRGLSTVGANTEPLIIVDGVLGASLANVDPNDIESVNVLKDGSASAIYGSRASSGVIIVTTKRGSKRGGGMSVEYNGFVAAATPFRQQPSLSASEYIAAGGNNLGSVTNWQDEVTRTGMTNVHNLAVSGGNQTTSFRMSTNFRNVQGILEGSGFNQINTRANLLHSALNDRLKIDINMSITNRNSNFSFNEALRYAVLFNPTAPIRFGNGDFYQAILFDNFNPVAIIEQNVNRGNRRNINYNAKIDYSITDNLTATVNYGQQFENNLNGEYYSRNSLFRGLNRGGLARRYTNSINFTLFEAYATYAKEFGKFDLSVTGGYSFQEDEFQDVFIEMGDFPSDALGFNALELSGDRLKGIPGLLNIQSNTNPKNQIVAQFARLNLTFDKGIFFNASVRREGSTRLGADNRYGIFPAFGAGVDILKYANIASMSAFKFRAGYGVTGALPRANGLAQDRFQYDFANGGNVQQVQLGNPNLRWEQKEEINLGIDFGFSQRLTGSLDVYTRNIKDFIQPTRVQIGQQPANTQFQNSGSLRTRGIELALNYTGVKLGQVTWNPGIVASTYRSTLTDFVVQENMIAELGAPGQNGTFMVRSKVGEEVGQIWGPVFDGVEGNGAPRFRDINGDGQVIAAPGQALNPNADFQVLGRGFPTLELGWTNEFRYKNWDLNAFFRGAFGHSLVNNFRAFYEPIDPGAINSYNRVITDKAVPGLTVAQFSSLYVERGDFLKLDNITLGYNFKTAGKTLRSARLFFTVQNAFILTNYTGIDPEPVLQDFGSADNGGFQGTEPNVLAPGIDRRNSYFNSRTFTFGVNIGL